MQNYLIKTWVIGIFHGTWTSKICKKLGIDLESPDHFNMWRPMNDPGRIKCNGD